VLQRVHETSGYPLNLPADSGVWLSNPRIRASWVAVEDGRIVGHASRAVVAGDAAEAVWVGALGRRPGELAVVKRLFVDPSALGRGVGRRLFATVVADAYAFGLWPVLDVDEHGERARALYERAGFKPVGTIELTSSGGGTFRVTCYVGPPPGSRSV
jgi:GNAT superfamily N-acetyltransferase